MMPAVDAKVARPGRGYVVSLNGLRGVSVALVVAFHAFDWPRTGGFVGVALFFVLSGYLITGILLREHVARGRISLRAFYARRALRIMPLFYLTLIVAFLGLTILAGRAQRGHYLSSFIYEAAYVGDFYGLFTRNHHLAIAVGQFWTLAVEEQFYLLWPTILIVILRRRPDPSRCAWALGGAAVISAILRGLTVGIGTTARNLPTAPLDCLLLGCALAFFDSGGQLTAFLNPGRRRTIVQAIAGLTLVAVLCLPEVDFLAAFGAAYVAMAAAALVVTVAALVDGPVRRALENRILVRLGWMSYGLYALHPVVLHLLERHERDWPHPVRAGVGVAIAIVLAAISRRWFEGYFLALKDRRFRRLPSRPEPGTVGPPAPSPALS